MTYFSEILVEIPIISLNQMRLKRPYAKSQSFLSDLNMLIRESVFSGGVLPAVDRRKPHTDHTLPTLIAGNYMCGAVDERATYYY